MKTTLDWFTHKTVLHEPAMMLVDPDEIVIERAWLESVCKEVEALRKVIEAMKNNPCRHAADHKTCSTCEALKELHEVTND